MGVFFNLRMLLSCYKNKTKYTSLRKIWTLAICLIVYQVSILAMNTVGAWKELEVKQHEGHCSAIYLLVSTFMTFFVGGNLMVIVAIESRDPMANRNRELFPTCELLTTALLSLGISLFVMIRWYSSCHQDFAFHLMVFSVIVAITIIVFLLFVASGSCLQLDHTTPKPQKLKTSLPNLCTKSKGSLIFVALFLMCIGAAVTQYSSPQAFQPVLYLLIMNATVGIALPLAFNDLIYSSSEVENETKIAVISIS